MQAQKILRLDVDRRPGQSISDNLSERHRIRVLSKTPDMPKHTLGELLAQLLKRQAKDAMQCVGECQPASISHAMRRMRDIEETIRFVIHHGLVPPCECKRSDKQLLYATTLADLLECMKGTAQHHRAPECVAESMISAELREVIRKLDVIGGAIVRDAELQAMLFNHETEVA